MAPRPAGFAGTSQKQRIRLSEEASVVSALSSTPTGLNPLAYFLPFGSDPDHDEAGSNCREEVEAGAAPSQQPRSKVEFSDLCGSLEELVYLGEGSNGVVYSASWHGARVAVKFMLGNGDDSTHLQRCFTEAVLTRVLSHPCVVQCFATAIAQLTPEVWESINSKNQRHQAILQTTQLGRLCDAATQPPCPTLQPSTSSGRQGLLSAAAASAVSPRACALGAMSHMSGPCTPHECNGSSTSQPQLTDGLSGLTTGCGADASAEMEAAAASRAAAEMRKVALFFAEEEEGAGEAGSSAGGAGDDAQNGEVEGISLLQALTDLQAEAGRHCTVVVMEYMDAGTLHQGIVRGEFSARKNAEHRPKLLSLLLTAQELAQGMAHLHGLDILHGDLKPTNVLLKGTPCQYAPSAAAAAAATAAGGGMMCTDPRGYTAKIADLGLARPCVGESAQLTSDQWGALAYLAPEAAKGSCCKASDVYSFGVMLWEMSAGVRPYLGLTTPQVLMGLVTGTLQLTWPSDGSVYAPLRALGVACTDPNSADRPTFEVAARALGRMVRHIRAASEPLRQRHSSALSMEAGGGCGSGIAGVRQLQHASRSMPMCRPGAANGNGQSGVNGLANGNNGLGSPGLLLAHSGLPAGPNSPIAMLGRAGTGGGSPPLAPARGSPNGPNGNGSPAAMASLLCGPGGLARGGAAGAGSGGSGAFAPSSPVLGPGPHYAQPQPQGVYPRTRLGSSGVTCGGVAARSPLGGAASFRLPSSPPMVPAAAAPSKLPSGPATDGGAAGSASARGRPESSPAQHHIVATAAAPAAAPLTPRVA